MEGKKISGIELDQYEYKILSMLVHAESYDTILSEFKESSYILGDCLRNLVRQKILRIMEWEESTNSWKARIIYDADRLKEYRYQLTSLGLAYLEEK